MNRFIKTTLATSLLAISACSFAAPTTAPAANAVASPATNAAAPAANANAAAAPAAAAIVVADNTTNAAPANNANPANANANINPAEKAKIESIVHDYLINKPEVLVEALQILQQRQYEQAQQTVKQTQKTASTYATDLFHQASDPVAGNPAGKITVVEFFDYQCPHCVDMAPTIEAIIKANPDVRVIYKEFPIRGPLSELAARAALAAKLQGKYVEFSHALLTSKQPLSEDTIYAIAKSSGLDVDKLKKDMKDSVVEKQIKDNQKLAQNLKLMGTPAIFIGKTDGKGDINYVPGQMDQKQMQEMIDKAGK